MVRDDFDLLNAKRRRVFYTKVRRRERKRLRDALADAVVGAQAAAAEGGRRKTARLVALWPHTAMTRTASSSRARGGGRAERSYS